MEINAISKTAFFCCGIRAQDARSRRSICADIYADDFMSEEGRKIFAMFSKSPKQNVSNVVRSRIIQDEISRHLKRNKDLQVVNIGAGFDSRAYRLAGGKWFEFDEAPIIEHKNVRVPASVCANPLQRVAVDFGKGELASALSVCDPNAETLIVIEGVFMYLEKPQIDALLKTLRETFSNHMLLCDLMDKPFFEKHMGKSYEQVRKLGSEFRFVERKPVETFTKVGYIERQKPISVVGRAREFKAFFLPAFILNTVLRSLRDGYRIHLFGARR